MADKIKYKDQISEIDQKIADLNGELKKISSEELLAANGESLYNLEVKLRKITNELSDLIAAKVLQKTISTKAFIEESNKLAKMQPQKLKNYGLRSTKLKMGHGTRVEILAPYFARPCLEKKTQKWGYFRHS